MVRAQRQWSRGMRWSLVRISEVPSVTWRVRTALPLPLGTAVVVETPHTTLDAGRNMSPLEKSAV